MESEGLVLSRAAACFALLIVAGWPLHRLLQNRLLSGLERTGMAVLAMLAAAASAWWALESIAAMTGTGIAALDQPTVDMVLAATPLGKVMEWRLVALFAVIAAAAAPFKALRLPVMGLAGAAALATIALTGHAGASEHGLHRAADALHLLAAALWIAALVDFALGAISRAGPDIPALAAFARTGSIAVAVLVLTGMANTLAIAGSLWPRPGPWHGLLALKLGLFGLMLALAANNRWRVVPALERAQPQAMRRLRLSVLSELAAGLGVVGVVAMLGVIDPHG
ncbi:MAG: CopD family protein [Novosphingobium meiothermophilum]|uniref:CopD family protein n=1 Tax=Novosphingobium TaxID=165696 RepID=UPI000D6E1884|nr:MULTISPECIES: CopD family protein [Novosphingobium]